MWAFDSFRVIHEWKRMSGFRKVVLGSRVIFISLVIGSEPNHTQGQRYTWDVDRAHTSNFIRNQALMLS